MATGTIIGPLRYRDTWNIGPDGRDELYFDKLASAQIMSSSDHPTRHNRSHSDLNGFSDRPRLPPISNFLEGAGRPDLHIRSSYHGPTISTATYPNLYTGLSLPPSLVKPQSWSPDGNTRQLPPPPQLESIQGFHQQETSDAHLVNHDYQRRVSGALPSLSHSDARSSISYSIPTPSHHSSSSPVQTTSKTVVREDFVDGKGTCYIYDDGSVCQKTVNGDTVNPKWGTTKAGKPRKRLGQACNTCREKKIKCDPSYPKCTQCQKFGRECRFEALSRPGQKSPKSHTGRATPISDHTGDLTMNARRSSAAPTEASTCSDSGQTVTAKPYEPRDGQQIAYMAQPRCSDNDQPTPAKRMRMQDQTSAENDFVSIQTADGLNNDAHHLTRRSPFSRDVDPYAVDPRLTDSYLKAYFAVVNATAFGLVPEKLFMQWVKRQEHKSAASKLVLYCMLAVGCRFGMSADRATHEKIFTEIASEGVTQAVGQFSIQLIHARLIYCLHEFQNGCEASAWDIGGGAMRGACAMRLNTEDGVAESSRAQESVYGLDKERLSECLRRTFWVGYIMDRFAVSCLGYATTFNRADLFLRLPCTEKAFESGRIPATKIFDGDEGMAHLTEREELSKLSSLALLAQIASLSCDVHILATRAQHQGSNHRRDRYASMRSKLEEQLRSWEESYVLYLKLDMPSPSESDAASPPRVFGGLHIALHHAYMVLHRYIHHASLSQSQIAHHARQAYEHACTSLEIAQKLVSRSGMDIQDRHVAATGAVSGYAIVEAIDILTAGGLSADLLGNDGRLMSLMMNGAVPLLDTLAEHWQSAKRQRELVSNRTKLLFNALQAGPSQGKVVFCVMESMVHSFSKDDDLVYGVDRLRYFAAMGWDTEIHGTNDMIEIPDTSRRNS